MLIAGVSHLSPRDPHRRWGLFAGLSRTPAYLHRAHARGELGQRGYSLPPREDRERGAMVSGPPLRAATTLLIARTRARARRTRSRVLPPLDAVITVVGPGRGPLLVRLPPCYELDS